MRNRREEDSGEVGGKPVGVESWRPKEANSRTGGGRAHRQPSGCSLGKAGE